MTDRRTIFTIVATLAISIIGAEAASVALAILEKPVPELLDDITKFAAGAIAAILARTSVDPGEVPAAEPSVEEVSPRPFNHEVN